MTIHQADGGMPVCENALQQALDAMAPPDIRLACRAIRKGDDAHLVPIEAKTITARVMERREASGAARFAARRLLNDFGFPGVAIPRGAAGEPIWPGGMSGSLAHDNTMAMAALSRTGVIRSIGIDIEPPEPLPAELEALVLTPDDSLLPDCALAARIAFSAKEAVYKAVYPLKRRILEYHDIKLDLAALRAETIDGHVARLFYHISTKIVTIAVI